MNHVPAYDLALRPPSMGYYYPAAVPEPADAEPRMPTCLGVCAAIFVGSVCIFSAAGEQYSWIPQLIAVLVAITWLVGGMIILGQPIRWSKPIVYYVLYFLWASVTILVTTNVEYWYIIWRTTAKVVVITVIVSQCVRTRKDLLACCLAICLSSFLVAFLGKQAVVQALEYSRGFRGAIADARAGTTLLGNAVNLGVYGVFVMICATFCLIGYRHFALKALALASAVAGFYLVAASGSRSAMLGMVVGAVTLYWYYIRKLGTGDLAKKAFVIAFALCFLAGTTYAVMQLPFFFRMKETIANPHFRQKEPRYVYFFNALGAVAERPLLGLGMGGFALHRLGTNARGEGHFSHSTISETLAATGVPGFALYYGSALALYLQLRRLRKQALPPREAACVDLIMAMFWVYLTIGVVLTLMYHRLVWPFLGACCGYLWNLDRRATQRPPAGAIDAMPLAIEPPRPQPRPRTYYGWDVKGRRSTSD
jgi:hypothetical protein